ncbi:hypothetical protein GCM10009623_12380 [Nocardioides aestuarii]|uniref:Uncharacterized protein n=1 Tax=Nocardioides aestuarii TaxID=252231 RepID=A0ABW4TKZ1_9ACTN
MSPLTRKTRDQLIAAWDVGAPPDWASLPLASVDGPEGQAVLAALRDVAEDLADGEEAQARLTAFLVAVQPRLLEDQLLLLGVWVPDREAGDPLAVMKAELLTDADRDGFESLVHAADPPEGQERLHLETLRVDLPAGPAVLVDHQGVVDGTIEQYLQFVVFPDGTTDAISLAFTTTSLHLLEEFAVATRDIAESLTVELGPGGGR